MSAKASFEKFLIENQVINAQALQTAHREASAKRISVFQLLVEKGTLSDEALAQAAAKFHKVDFLAGPVPLNLKLVSEFPIFTLRRYRMIPLQQDEKTLTYATSNPWDLLAADEMRRLSKKQTRMVCMTESAIQQALAQVPSPAEPAQAPVSTRQETLSPSAVVGATAVVVDQLLERCILRSASDVHFEPAAMVGLVRERIDGVLYEVTRIPHEQFDPMVSRVKLLSGMDIVEKRLAQDGRFRFKLSNGGHAEIRSSTLPTIHGESLVLRVLRSDSSKPTLEMLDIGAMRNEQIQTMCNYTDGLIIVAGPTGSGKTTSIYAMLGLIDRKSQNLITVEDPVEYELDLASQVQINAKIGITFDSVLPSILRQDPDILMVGEMRDEATTQMVMRAAISGHLVFSTIHAPNAIQTLTRLIDMRTEPHLINASLKACISQRLLRRLCPACKKPYEATADERKILPPSNEKTITLHKAVGCDQCHNLGYKGRFAVIEILRVNDSFHPLIIEGDRKRLQELAESQGFITMKQHGFERVLAGETTLGELLANCT